MLLAGLLLSGCARWKGYYAPTDGRTEQMITVVGVLMSTKQIGEPQLQGLGGFYVRGSPSPAQGDCREIIDRTDVVRSRFVKAQ